MEGSNWSVESDVRSGNGDHHQVGAGAGAGGTAIKIKVFRGPNQHDLIVPSESTFGDLKIFIEHEIGLDRKEQKLYFRGIEKEDQEYLHMAGLKNNSKVLLKEVRASEERKVEVVKENSELPKGYAAVAVVRSDVDKFIPQVAALETAVHNGTKVAEKEFIVLAELLMRQLLKLDGIEAEGEGKVQRKIEVSRVQSLVETVDSLKERNANPFGNGNSSNVASSVPTTNWATFEPEAESHRVEPPSPTKVNKDWEVFE